MNQWGRSSRITSVALVVFLTIPILSIAARPLEISDEVQISFSTRTEQYPTIAADSDGNFHLIYSEYEDDVYEVRYQKISPSGKTLMGPSIISPNDIGYPGGCRITIDSKDRVHVVFAVNISTSQQHDVYYAQLTKNGSITAAADKVHTSSAYSDHPALDTDRDGNVHIVWREAEEPSRIYWMILDPSGSVKRPGAPISGDLGIGGDVAEPYICVDASKTSNVVWAQKDSELSTWTVYYTRVESSGSVAIEPLMILSDLVGDYWGVEMAIDNSSELHLAMMFVELDRTFSIRYARLGTDGELIEEREMDDPPDGEAWHPSIVVSPEDDIYLSYQREDDDYASDWNIYLSVYWKEDGEWQDAVQLTHNDRSQYGVVAVSDYIAGIVFDRDGDMYFVSVKEAQSNYPPTARIAASHSERDVGEEIVINSSLSFDPDGSVAAYRFDFGDGNVTDWVDDPVTTYVYQFPGCFTVALRVRDDDGLESENTASLNLTVLTNEAPTASIITIVPNPAMYYEEVTFVGQGEDIDGSIEFYLWESNLDGVLDNSASFSTIALSTGLHRITLRVRDDDGYWSEPKTLFLDVKPNWPLTIIDQTELPKEINTQMVVYFRVMYTDIDNDRPGISNLLYAKGTEWRVEPLREVDVTDTNFIDGKEYYYNIMFNDSGTWRYAFEFDNQWDPKTSTDPVKFKVREVDADPLEWLYSSTAGLLVVIVIAIIVVVGAAYVIRSSMRLE